METYESVKSNPGAAGAERKEKKAVHGKGL